MATVRFRKQYGNWQAQVRLDGHKPESATFKTEKEARAWGERREAELRSEAALHTNRIDGETKPTSDKAHPTFESLIERYTKEVAVFHRSKMTSINLKLISQQPFVKKPVDQIAAADFVACCLASIFIGHRRPRLAVLALVVGVTSFGLCFLSASLVSAWGAAS